MAGRIREEDVELVKERIHIEEVVREHVTLSRAGTGRLKGLCPFHDEKTASFTVRPAHGRWHCFGCNEGGDVIAFLMKIDHISFVEAVEALAGRCGVQLRYAEGGPERDEGAHTRRRRLLEAHRAAEEFYREALADSADAQAGREFLTDRAFDAAAAERFGVGYAPRGGDQLVRHLLAKGFTLEELTVGGLAGRSQRGPYDRFRGRLLWPIRDITGATMGFGARRLYDEDRIAAKYLNTAETPIYKKTSALYGLDLAKRTIAQERRAVVVEGYTDVMACHLAGVESAVATCGTAFGADHVGLLRRILRDDASARPARTIFTFDGDAAGQQAAMRAFELDGSWASQSFVAVADAGQDPCDLRLHAGDEAVRRLVESAVPMFEFVVRTRLGAYDLDTVEGRVGGMRAVAPIIAGIRDEPLRREYTRTVAGLIGVPITELGDQVASAGTQRARSGGTAPRGHRPRGAQGSWGQVAGRPAPDHGLAGPGAARGSERLDRPDRPAAAQPTGVAEDGMAGEAPADEAVSPTHPLPDPNDPATQREQQLLQVLLQHPRAVADEDAVVLAGTPLRHSAHQLVLRAALGAWDERGELSARAWIELVEREAGAAVEGLVARLSVADLPTVLDPHTGGPPQRYVSGLVDGVRDAFLSHRIALATGALQRAESQDPDRARAIAVELTALQTELTQVRARGQ